MKTDAPGLDPEGCEAGRAPGWTRPAMLLLLLGFAFSVLADPTADPPFGSSGLGGQLLLGARALIPTESVVLGDWNPFFIAPSHLAITAMVYRWTGVTVVAGHWVNAAAALLLVAVFHEVVRRMLGSRRALLAALLLVVNPAFHAAVRDSSPAVFSLLWMLVAVWVCSGPGIGSARPVRRWASFLAGAILAWAALVENAPSNVFFLGAALVWASLVRLHAWKMPWVSSTKRRLRWFWSGALVVGGGYAVVVALHARAAFATWGHFLQVTPQLIAANLIRSPLNLAELFRLMPVVTLVATLFFLFYGKSVFGPVARHRPLDEVRIWLFGWLVSGFLYFTLVGSHRLETLVLLVLPMCVLAAEGLSHLYRLRAITRPRLDVMIVVLLIAGCAWFGCCTLVDRLRPVSGFAGWETHRIRWSYLFVAILWPLSTSLMVWLYLKWKQQELRLAPSVVVAATFGIVAGSLVPGVLSTAAWWSARTHELDAGRAVLAELPAGSLVVGSWAPSLTLGTSSGAAVIWSGINDREAPWENRITHFLLGKNERRPSHPVVGLQTRPTQDPGPPSARLAIQDDMLELIPLDPIQMDPVGGPGEPGPGGR